MFLPEKVAMKCPRYEPTRAKRAERSSAAAAAEPNALRLKASPVKEPTKPECPPEKVAPPLLFPVPNQHHGISAVHDKENSSKEHDRTLCTEGFEDSGYLSLHNSQIDEDEEHTQGRHATAAVPHQDKSPRKSGSVCTGSLPAVSTPLDCPRRKNLMYSLSSTPSKEHDDPNLPIIKFQRAVCEELSKNYSKTKRYDWSIVGKVAESHLLDRVIGGQMGLEYVDVFSSLLSRNMRSILTGVLALLGDMDLISCKKVSKTWRKIICEDTAAMSRCQRAERTLQESTRSLRQRGCGLTRDTAESRVVLSCMQTMASFKTPSSSSSSTSSSTPSCGVNRRPALSQRGNKCGSGHTRFHEFVQAASCLKQHESLRPCKRCGSPATHSAEAQRATCKRQSCQFDFCTRCQETYHGSTPCRVVNPRPHYPQSTATPVLPGSARSKRNLRRL